MREELPELLDTCLVPALDDLHQRLWPRLPTAFYCRIGAGGTATDSLPAATGHRSVATRALSVGILH